ncbi:MAG: hypothetical protein ACXU8N_05105 [Telluria sp.]
MQPERIEAQRAPDLPVPVDEPAPEPAHPHHPPVPNPIGDEPQAPDHNPARSLVEGPGIEHVEGRVRAGLQL